MSKLFELWHVCKKIGKTEILNDITFSLQENSIAALIGPNGAGKTTLIRILLGLYKPTSGKVIMDGLSPENVGFVLHANGLYPAFTVYDNLKLYARLYGVDERKIDSVIGEIGLADKRDEKVATLSRGMRQKTALARAVLHEPSVLILDEPTVGLDTETKIWFREYLEEFASGKGRGVLLSSHELTELEKVCTDVIILRNGRIADSDRVMDISCSMEDYYLRSGGMSAHA